MVPGWLGGAYRFDEVVIDFVPLCAAAGARWVQAELKSLDDGGRTMRLSDGQTLTYDVLSLNVGSTLHPPAPSKIAATKSSVVIGLRPLSELRLQYDAFLSAWMQQDGVLQPLTVTAVGGGAAGFESLLAVLQRLRKLRPDRVVNGALMSRSMTLLPGFSSSAQRAARAALQRAGVVVQLGSAWSETTHRPNDLVLWATGAQAHGWQLDAQRRGGLAVNSQGFVRIDRHLRSVSHSHVFAVGDCAHWDADDRGLPKAGVYAVRMGPVLLHNLRATLQGGALETYMPQSRFLTLLATADGRAIASWGPLGAEGMWAWYLKNGIDRRFVRRFNDVARQRG